MKDFKSRGRVQQLEHAETGDGASQPLKENSFPAKVFSHTLRSFAEADVAQSAIPHGGTVPPAIEQQVHQMIDNHGAELEEQNDTNPLPSLETLDECNRIFDMVDDIASINKPRGLTPELDHSESQLKSEELLQARTRDCLQFFIKGLIAQYSSCSYEKGSHLNL